MAEFIDRLVSNGQYRTVLRIRAHHECERPLQQPPIASLVYLGGKIDAKPRKEPPRINKDEMGRDVRRIEAQMT